MKSLLAMMALIGVLGCATAGVETDENVAKLTQGMSQQRVLSLLGTPDHISKTENTETRWVYEFMRKEKRGRNLFIDFKEGALVRAGELSPRDLASSTTENENSVSCLRRAHLEMLLGPRCID